VENRVRRTGSKRGQGMINANGDKTKSCGGGSNTEKKGGGELRMVERY